MQEIDRAAYIEYVDLKGNLGKADRWLFKPALWSLVAVSILELLCQLPGAVSLLLIPLSLLGYLIAIFAFAAIAVYCFIKKRPRRGASVLLVFLLPVLLWRPINWTTAVVHVGLTTSLGIGQLGAPTKSSDDKFAVYDWSTGLVTNPSTFLIHDVTDEVALPMAQHTNPPNPEHRMEDLCAGKVDHLIGHYYICSI